MITSEHVGRPIWYVNEESNTVREGRLLEFYTVTPEKDPDDPDWQPVPYDMAKIKVTEFGYGYELRAEPGSVFPSEELARARLVEYNQAWIDTYTGRRDNPRIGPYSFRPGAEE